VKLNIPLLRERIEHIVLFVEKLIKEDNPRLKENKRTSRGT
jgi:DNA-binding NtrC family response regulator